jgi:hypothetical protein
MRLERGSQNPEYGKKIEKLNGFEPFEIPEEEQQDRLFVNLYHGHLSSNMELNRKAIERTLKIAHLDGQVFLTSFSPSRNRSLDANPDGSVSQKKTIFIGEKLEEIEENENPYSRPVSIPQGWRIEINDQRIMNELIEKRVEPGKRENIFVSKFNSALERNLEKCVVKEKLSSIKDKYFRVKTIWSLAVPSVSIVIFFQKPDLGSAFIVAGATLFTYGIGNLRGQIVQEERKMLKRAYEERFGVTLNLDNGYKRKIDHLHEFILPPVEIDKVAESITYLNIFGNKLVKRKRI